jgi:DNA ligase (NAD+)
MEMTPEELIGIEDVGPGIANGVIEYFANDVNRLNIQRLKDAGVTLEIADESQSVSNVLDGKSIVISGVFTRHSRDEYKHIIEVNGGKNVSSISKKTDYVLAGENMGPAKLEKATKLGITILDEDTFLSMISSAESTDNRDEDIDNTPNDGPSNDGDAPSNNDSSQDSPSNPEPPIIEGIQQTLF